MISAREAGVNFFDTAPMYGDGASEALLGRFLSEQGARDTTIIATKIRPGKMRPEQVVTECEESLQRLQTDYIDLYQTHWSGREVPIAETWGAMQRLQEQGKVRHIGVCNMGPRDLNDVSALHKPLTNQLPLNLLWRVIEVDILPRCLTDGIGVLAYSPLMHGILADKYQTAADVPDGRARTRHFSSRRAQTRHEEAGCEAETFAALDRIRKIARSVNRSMSSVALAWTLQQAGIVSVIAGARNAEQLHSNVEFLDDPLPQETLRQLNDATEDVRRTLGRNPDMWEGGESARYR